MGKQPFVSHVVNGYSRYDVPESKAFSCTPGPLYPARVEFINARDRVKIAQGIDVRSNPFAVPTFNPYTVRLHRFWVPLQLYHPEMRTNSSKFDMNNLSTNWVRASIPIAKGLDLAVGYSNSLMSWLRVSNRELKDLISSAYDGLELPPSAASNPGDWVTADSYLAYWDIVRNYYGYSQWGLYSIAWPASWAVEFNSESSDYEFAYANTERFFYQRYCNLEFLDAFFESQFYPNAIPSSNGSYNRSNLFFQIINSQITLTADLTKDGYPVDGKYLDSTFIENGPLTQFDTGSNNANISYAELFLKAHPLAVVPSNPDRFSRLLPLGSSDAVSMSGVTTIPQLAIASRLQEYKDLLGAGGNRYSDWLETFFASKIGHVDRPKLLFSASQTVNVQVVMNQGGYNNFQGPTESGNSPLGQQGGSVAFNSMLGRSQSYYFDEPGYLIDLISIRPVYYWSSIRPDYLNYFGADYFNPIYNDIGYQDVPYIRFKSGGSVALVQEPCFNEFRSSYDEVLGMLSSSGLNESTNVPLYSYWVQQRKLESGDLQYYPFLFVDMEQVNSPFKSNTEDNFFVNLSYTVTKKNLVNKTFATRLSNR